MTPTPDALQDGDLFKAPAPDEFFGIKSYVDPLEEPTVAGQFMAWLPVLAGVAAGPFSASLPRCRLLNEARTVSWPGSLTPRPQHEP